MRRGRRTWKRGVPNDSVSSVKVKQVEGSLVAAGERRSPPKAGALAQKPGEAELVYAFEDELPTMTSKTLNRAKSVAKDQGWELDLKPEMSDFTMSDYINRLGLEEPEDESEEEEQEGVSLLLSGVNRSLPATFDARQKWPQCADVIGHIRNQGSCGSCWAFAAAGALDGRLCIASGGKFVGKNAFVSAGYLASCSYGGSRDGCAGGLPNKALKFAAAHGVPTGLAHTAGCVPYFAAGDATQHLNGASFSSPPCPTTCEIKGYPRTLEADKFTPKGLAKVTTLKRGDYLTTLKQVLVDSGPVPIAIYASPEFSYYKGGIYNPGCRVRPNHATNAIGFGPGYFLSTNSYGPEWGEGGTFKVAECVVIYGFAPNAPATSETGYPVPNGPGSPPYPSPPPPPPPKKHGEAWEVKEGDCTIDDNDCVMSPNFPSAYKSSGTCTIEVLKPVVIEVKDFNTEEYFDVFTVNGKGYSGAAGPNGVSPLGAMTWKADEQFEVSGFKLCPIPAAPPATAAPTPAPTPAPTLKPTPPPTPPPTSPPTPPPTPPPTSTPRPTLRPTPRPTPAPTPRPRPPPPTPSPTERKERYEKHRRQVFGEGTKRVTGQECEGCPKTYLPR